jgi:type II secretion system protein H
MRFIHHKAPGRRGFTLVELMVVVIIIGIMSAMIVAEMHGTFQNALLRSTSRELINAFNVAGSRAVSVNRPHRIRLDAVTHRYFLERSARGGLDFFPVRDLPGSEGTLDPRVFVMILEPGVDVADDAEPSAESGNESDGALAGREQAICFYPDGTADARQIELQDSDGFRMALRINPITARVQIVERERP